LWKSIIDAEHNFLIRVGGNVRLLTKLGYYARERDGIVYVWPDSAARKKQPPLVLRLIHLKGERGDVYLLTNVLNSRHLSSALASRLYKLRWGIELQFRTLKQTFGRRTLRSRTPDRAYAELEWSLLGLWIIHLFAVKEQVAIGEPPKQTSAAMAIHVVRSVFFSGVKSPRKVLTSRPNFNKPYLTTTRDERRNKENTAPTRRTNHPPENQRSKKPIRRRSNY